MAIRVGNSVGAGPLAAAAFGGGQGQARAAFSAGRAAAAERELARKAAEAEAERQRQLALQGQTTQQALMRTNYDLQQQAAEAAQERELSGFERTFTTRQKLQAQQWADAEARAMSDPSFSDKDKEEIRFRFAQLRAGLQPVARPKAPTPAEIFARNTFTDPKTGRVYKVDETGKILADKPVYEPPERQPTWQDKLKARELAMKMATDGETGAVNQTEAARLYAEMIGDVGGPGAGADVRTMEFNAQDVAAGPGLRTMEQRPTDRATVVPLGGAQAASVAPRATPGSPVAPAEPAPIVEAQKKLAEARAKAGGIETKDVKAAKAELEKARKAVHEERAFGVADTETPEGIALRLEQIGRLGGRDGPIGLAGIDREADLDPAKVRNLATAEYQIKVAEAAVKEAEKEAAEKEAEAKARRERIGKLGAAPDLNGAALLSAQGAVSKYSAEAEAARVRAKEQRERIEELGKRRAALESERKQLEIRQVARAVKAGGGLAPPAASTQARATPASPSTLRPEEQALAEWRLRNRVPGGIRFDQARTPAEWQAQMDEMARDPGKFQGVTSGKSMTPGRIEVTGTQADADRGELATIKQRLAEVEQQIKLARTRKGLKKGGDVNARVAALEKEREWLMAQYGHIADLLPPPNPGVQEWVR